MRLPSYAKVAMVVMVRVLECMVSAGSAAVTDMRGECATPLTPLFSCVSFMQSNGAGGRPSAECCNAMAQVQITSAKCFRVIAKDGASAFIDFPFTYNTTLELLLPPSLCHLRTNASKCIVHTECGGFWRCHKNTILIAGSASSTTLVIVVIFGSLLRQKYSVSKETLSTNIRGILSASNGVISTKLFIGNDMKNAASSFSTRLLLGSGGFGDVYKGCLEDDTIAAVKVAKKDSTKSTEQVLNELKILSQVNHKCVVRLLGCCIELEQPMLVYEFVPNGTLYEHIHTDRFGFLNWQQRLKITHQAAHGLAYLHSFAVPPIYHRDVKSSNVLLDANCNAKISDFRLSRLIDENRTHVSTCLQGTMGYLDPEYYRRYQLTDKSDVYSFGVVLLELLTSQKAIDCERSATEISLVVYVQHRVDEGTILDALDRNLISEGSLEGMNRLCSLAIRCLHDKRKHRPSMKDVVEEIGCIIGTVEPMIATSVMDREGNGGGGDFFANLNHITRSSKVMND